ncbi:MAG TPA: SGNH/GDSL hydrolase family protein [Pseudonocardiaceae bacterium]|jgi:lysophospholipase L1-like esterase|nr:SGNH/GDSL hydrolase family protein [Pseudonocardiaceae bacterium]
MPAIRLSALGDSFAEGRGDPGPAGPWYGWVTRLAELLGVPPSGVRNLGTHQATTQDVVDRQLPAALVNKSPLNGVIVGVNDLVSDFHPGRLRRNLSTIFQRLAGFDTVVFTATYADIPANLPVPETFRALLRERFAAANEMLREIAAGTGALCMDVTAMPEWSDPAMWSADGLHPSPLGHQWFAETTADLLERATGLSLAVAR